MKTPENNEGSANKWGWLQVLGIILPILIAVVGVTLYISGIKANAETTATSQGKDIENLKKAVEEIPKMKDDIASIKEAAASTNQLLHDLAQYRFQYDSRQSDMKVKTADPTPMTSTTIN